MVCTQVAVSISRVTMQTPRICRDCTYEGNAIGKSLYKGQSLHSFLAALLWCQACATRGWQHVNITTADDSRQLRVEAAELLSTWYRLLTFNAPILS